MGVLMRGAVNVMAQRARFDAAAALALMCTAPAMRAAAVERGRLFAAGWIKHFSAPGSSAHHHAVHARQRSNARLLLPQLGEVFGAGCHGLFVRGIDGDLLNI
jgi:hypothetical protein